MACQKKSGEGEKEKEAKEERNKEVRRLYGVQNVRRSWKLRNLCKIYKYFSQISQYWPDFRGVVGYLRRNKQIQNVDFPLCSLAFCLPAYIYIYI